MSQPPGGYYRPVPPASGPLPPPSPYPGWQYPPPGYPTPNYQQHPGYQQAWQYRQPPPGAAPLPPPGYLPPQPYSAPGQYQAPWPSPGRGHQPHYQGAPWSPGPPPGVRGSSKALRTAFTAMFVIVGVCVLGLFLLGLTTDSDPVDRATGGFTPIEVPNSGGSSAPTDPSQGPVPVIALEDHPLFASPDYQLPAVPCELSEWGQDLATARSHFQSAVDCMNGMWFPVLDEANLPSDRPGLVVVESPQEAVSPCTSGGDNFAAFYCPVNETIYMPLESLGVDVIGDEYGYYLSILAHEYGHHVQLLTGIIEARQQRTMEVGRTSDAGYELSRRTELQVQCFGGMVFSSAQESDTIVDDQIDVGVRAQYLGEDTPTHGTSQNNGRWFEQGYERNRADLCNTWAADSGDVS